MDKWVIEKIVDDKASYLAPNGSWVTNPREAQGFSTSGEAAAKAPAALMKERIYPSHLS